MDQENFAQDLEAMVKQIENSDIEKLSELAKITGLDSAKEFVSVDFNGENLRSPNLTDANLTGADLTGADLQKANLTGAYLHLADLTGADLQKANLTGAKLTGADLTDAKLQKANLTGANLMGADLTGTILNGVKVENTEFGYNPGINKELRREFEARGAIFVDSPEDL